jgi:hypothetical protein
MMYSWTNFNRQMKPLHHCQGFHLAPYTELGQKFPRGAACESQEFQKP